MKTISFLSMLLFSTNLMGCRHFVYTEIKKQRSSYGAQVFRQSKLINIKKGVNEVIIKDVSPYLNKQHIQATAIGNGFMILDAVISN